MDECKQDGGPMECQAKTVLFCSPDKRNYKDFLKIVGTTIRYLPVWTWDEIDSCRDLLYGADPLRSRDAVLEAFDRWGGIPRFVLEKLNDPAAQLTLDAAVAVTDLQKLQAAVGSIDAAGDLSHKLLHIIVEKPYIRYHVSLGTMYIADKVVQKLANEQKDAFELFLRTSTSPLMAKVRGILFEEYAHRRLSPGGVFKIKQLVESAGAGEERELELLASVVCSIREVKDIAPFQQGDYLKPSISNFPLVDSILYPDKWFQMTVSQKHPVSHVLAKKILDQIPGDVHVSLYFVVPPDVYDDFQWQPIVESNKRRSTVVPSFMTRVTQHVLMLPLGSSEARRSLPTKAQAALRHQPKAPWRTVFNSRALVASNSGEFCDRRTMLSRSKLATPVRPFFY